MKTKKPTMEKTTIISGTQYQFSLEGLVFIGKNKEGIGLHYREGLQVQIDISDTEDKERQYKEICQIHQNHNVKTAFRLDTKEYEN